jgi:hypothetical protein
MNRKEFLLEEQGAPSNVCVIWWICTKPLDAGRGVSNLHIERVGCSGRHIVHTRFLMKIGHLVYYMRNQRTCLFISRVGKQSESSHPECIINQSIFRCTKYHWSMLWMDTLPASFLVCYKSFTTVKYSELLSLFCIRSHSMVDVHWCFGGMKCLHFQGWWVSQTWRLKKEATFQVLMGWIFGR